MRDNVDVWPQPLWTTHRPSEVWAPDRPAWSARTTVWVGLLISLVGAELVLALVVAPSAGAAGGCGGA